jgi:hypothetical protein
MIYLMFFLFLLSILQFLLPFTSSFYPHFLVLGGLPVGPHKDRFILSLSCMSVLHLSFPHSGQAVVHLPPIGSLPVTWSSPSFTLVWPGFYLAWLVLIFETNSSCMAYLLSWWWRQ